MKPRALKFSVGAAACLLLGLTSAGLFAAAEPDPAAAAAGTPPPLSATAAPVDAPPPATPVPSKPPKASKKSKSAKDPSATPRPKTPKGIQFPLPVGQHAADVKIPELGPAGEVLQEMMAAKMTRLDDEHVQMSELKIELHHPDGKSDFHIVMPTSIFNLKTRIITSDQPVTVKTDDFELSGERMEFNMADQSGKLLGRVSMHIHNLKEVAAVPGVTPVPP